MNRNKFKYVVTDTGQIIKDWTIDELELSMRNEKRGEILVREEIEWTVDQMRRYLHGPCTKFIVEMFKDRGDVYTDKEIHSFIRDQFLPVSTKEVSGKILRKPVSSESIGRKRYIQWINDVNDWCIKEFGMGLPPAEKVE